MPCLPQGSLISINTVFPKTSANILLPQLYLFIYYVFYLGGFIGLPDKNYQMSLVSLTISTQSIYVNVHPIP